MRQNNRKIALSEIVLAVFSPSQIACTFFLYQKNGGFPIRNTGWIILWISAVFGWMPIFTLKKWGGMQKGKSYIKTTMLVDRGFYASVWHPQYLAGIPISISLPLIAQNWILFILGMVCIYIYYFDTYKEEKCATEKSGDPYKAYQKRVSRLSLMSGMIKSLSEKARKS